MVRARRASKVIVLVLSVAAPFVGADEDSAQTFIREATDDVLAAVEASPTPVGAGSTQAIQIVETYIGPRLDLSGAAKVVLGQHWRGASPDERARSVAVFRTLASQTFAGAVPKFAGARVEILPHKGPSISGTTQVRTRALPRSGPPLRIDFRVHRVSGRWAVIDFSIEGLSMLATYRSDFTQTLRRQGVSGLIDALEARLQR